VVETARRRVPPPSWPPSKTTVIAWVLAALLCREWWSKTPVWLQKLLLRPLKRLIVSPLRKFTRRIVTTTRGNSDPATTTSESAERREQAQQKVQFFSDSSDDEDEDVADTVVGKLSAIMALAQSTTDSVVKFEGFQMQGALLASLKMVQDSKKTTAELWDKFYESSGKPLFVSDATTEIDADLEVVVPEGEDVAAPPPTSNTIEVDDSPEARKELLEKWIDLLHLADWAYLEETNEIRSKLKELAANNTDYKWSLVRHVKTDEPGRVGHYLALDTESKTALISVKGTSALSDMITDACGVPVRFNVTTENIGDGLSTSTTSTVSCHEGILDASLALAEDVQPLVENLFLPAGYRVLLIGHSLGMSLVYSSRFFYVPSILSVVLTL